MRLKETPMNRVISRRTARLAVLLLVLGVGGAGFAQERDPAPPSQEASVPGVPVAFDGRVLFTVSEPLGPFTAAERARAAEERIARLANDPFYLPELFHVGVEDDSATAYYQDSPIGVVSAEDAAAHGITTEEGATALIQTVRTAVEEYRERNRPAAFLRAAVVTIVATAALVGALVVLGRLRRRLALRLEAFCAVDSPPRPFVGSAVAREAVWAIGRRALHLAHWLAVAAVVVVYLQVEIAVVPMTRGYVITLASYALVPLATLWRGLLARIGDLFFILVAVVITSYLVKALKWLHLRVADGSIRLPALSPEWSLPLYKVLRLTVIALCAVVIYPYIPGSDTEVFKGLGLFVGAIFTLGSSAASSNFLSGLVLMSMRAYRVGDRVKIAGHTGDVVEMTLVMTRLKTVKNEEVTIPNARVLGAEIVNQSAHARAEGLIVHTSVTIGYDAPWRQVHALLVEAARRTPGILPEPAPFVVQTSLDDFYVTYELNAATRDANAQQRVYSGLHQSIQDVFNEAGVEIMSPHFAALRDGNAVTLPASHLPPEYQPPPFRVARPGTAPSGKTNQGDSEALDL